MTESALTSNVTDVALIFEGGGMRASYSAGVLTALLEGEIFCDWVGGISAGTTCIANYLTRDAARAKRSFTDLVLEPEFGGVGTFLRGKGLFNAEWIYEHTSGPDEALPFNWEVFNANPAGCGIGAFRCEDGEMVYWGRGDIVEQLDLMRRVRASSSMPVLMPWAMVDGIVYTDGALGPTGGFAIDAAKAAGYQRFLVVTTRERGYRKQKVKRPKALRAVMRRYPAVAQGLIDRPANYNRSLDELHALETEGRAFLLFPEHMPIGNNERDLAKLDAMYEQGLAQGRAAIPAIREFCGLA